MKPMAKLLAWAGLLFGSWGLALLLLWGVVAVAQTVSSSPAKDPATGYPLRPDPQLTPGDVLPVTSSDVCVAGYSRKVRNVPIAVKRSVYRRYGISNPPAGMFEVDHLISLELGGSNSIRNLWPQSYKTTPWNAHVKDKLENRLHAEVCGGQTTLAAAQQEIARDWISAYRKRFEDKEEPDAATRP